MSWFSHEYNGFAYKGVAQLMADGQYQPVLTISKHTEEGVSEKQFFFDRFFDKEMDAAGYALYNGQKIIDGEISGVTIQDL